MAGFKLPCSTPGRNDHDRAATTQTTMVAYAPRASRLCPGRGRVGPAAMQEHSSRYAARSASRGLEQAMPTPTHWLSPETSGMLPGRNGNAACSARRRHSLRASNNEMVCPRRSAPVKRCLLAQHMMLIIVFVTGSIARPRGRLILRKIGAHRGYEHGVASWLRALSRPRLHGVSASVTHLKPSSATTSEAAAPSGRPCAAPAAASWWPQKRASGPAPPPPRAPSRHPAPPPPRASRRC